MKKMLFALLLTLAMFSAPNVVAQTEEPPKVESWSPYLSASYSITNTTSDQYKDNTYFGIEFGITKNNFGFFASTGRGSTKGAFASDDKFEKYWAEVGITLTQRVANVDLYGIAGVGSYFKSDSAFIEYGIGLNYPISDSFALGAKVTNWDGITYVSPTATVNL